MPDGPRKRRGPPLIGSERRKVSSIRIEPSLERYAIETWGGLSTAVHELLSAHRKLSARRRIVATAGEPSHE